MRIPFPVARSGSPRWGTPSQKVGITMLGRASGRHYLAFTGGAVAAHHTPANRPRLMGVLLLAAQVAVVVGERPEQSCSATLRLGPWAAQAPPAAGPYVSRYDEPPGASVPPMRDELYGELRWMDSRSGGHHEKTRATRKAIGSPASDQSKPTFRTGGVHGRLPEARCPGGPSSPGRRLPPDCP